MFTNLEEITHEYNIQFNNCEKKFKKGILKCFNKNNYLTAIYKLGLFYNKRSNCKKLAIKYYLLAVDLGCIDSMINIGLIYRENKKEWFNMNKYLTMAAEHGSLNAMHLIADYYSKIGYIEGFPLNEQEELVIKYYLMAIDLGCEDAMYKLSEYYAKKTNPPYTNYTDLKMKYLIMAGDNGSVEAMKYLSKHYKNVEKNFDLMLKYLKMAAQNGCTESIAELQNYHNTHA